ncbi:hypothetical protein B4U45_11395 [Mycobacterium persicum]|uniref:Uncharacterized protein n=1 Tax=Mycobacterium persicum TaxID=1487726 RepID=A0A8E2ITS1_9MYCO|nr:hypothetical protein [Mycobacterium persicum]KZS83496.1 hypothetical protein A4G31_10915 [Mycobacterium persicum]ORB95163.1 hypothetical protein B1T44_12340 [Mycobacterium persicum]ORC07126.1 hypothetical protein B4U45_11395 [Mycobacterium persicum]VAZ80231.1 hypothetical protein LAUMK15_05285 [Mycobacterium persicum]VBA30161.1 hypothetical protein LAUMK4_04985 [Mycobacterium persicum]
MSAVAVLLIAVGIADGWRRLSRAVWLPLVTGPAVVVACAALCGLWHARDIVPLGLAALAAVAWEVSCLRSERTGKHQRRALAVMVVGLAVLTTLSGLGSHAGGVAARWAQWVALPLGTVTPTRLLMVVGVVLLQLATGNQLIRLVLGAVGAVRPAGQPQPSDKLKGGRVLGPMERLLILSLGLGGQVGAAGAVVAAKGLIRFPELSAQKGRNGEVGIDEVTEYFLVGSFASWLLALGGMALILATR